MIVVPQHHHPTSAIAQLPYTEPAVHHDCGYVNIECPRCKALHWIDEKVVKSSVINPSFGTCCNHGKIALPLLAPLPPALAPLYINDDACSKNFKENIWAYNQAFAFTSLGVKEDHSINRRGPPVFCIQGELAHWSGSLLPEPGHTPIYAQLYIYEPHTAVAHCMSNNANSGLRQDTIALLEEVVHAHHQYAPDYLHAHEVLAQYPEALDVSVFTLLQEQTSTTITSLQLMRLL